MGLVIYTALFGTRTKPLAEPTWFDPAVPMICFTDQPLRSEHWTIFKLPTEADPRRGNRRLKLLSHRAVGSDWTLYLDSNFVVQKDPRPLLNGGDFYVHKHHACANILQEADAIVRRNKDDPMLVAKQVARYRDLGFCTAENPQTRHSANGVILRHHTPQVMALNEAWWAEVDNYSYRDQLSLNFCAWRAGFSLCYWAWSVMKNPYFLYVRGSGEHVPIRHYQPSLKEVLRSRGTVPRDRSLRPAPVF